MAELIDQKLVSGSEAEAEAEAENQLIEIPCDGSWNKDNEQRTTIISSPN
jgi:hypothetical protein